MRTAHLLRPLVVVLLLLHGSVVSAADIETRTIRYEVDGQPYVGYLAAPADAEDAPGILVVHEWWGLNDYAKLRARKLAELGYVAFACDMYGEGRTSDTVPGAQALAGPFYGDRSLFRTRTQAGIDILRAQPGVDPERIAAIGYCFGGTAVLELARSGADIDGVVCFHGNLTTANPADARNIRCSVMVCNGADDAFVSMEDRQALIERMSKAGVDLQFIEYAGAVHSFTNPKADDLGMDSVGYDALSDRRSWAHMQLFFDEQFGD